LIHFYKREKVNLTKYRTCRDKKSVFC